MTAREFFYMVAAMRAAQKAYFKERTPVHLRAARALEGDCDREILRVKQIMEEWSNGNTETDERADG